MTTSSAFSSSETAALERQTEYVGEPEVTLQQIWGQGQSEECVNWIRKNGFKKVCLQFPDNYLRYSESIATSIKRSFGSSEVQTFILADTSYGSCCVDEIAAAHVEADSVIHFGNACRSKVSRLPVLYSFPRFEVDFEKLYEYINSLAEVTEGQVINIYLDLGYHHLLDESNEELVSNLIHLKAKKITLVTYCGDTHGILTPACKLSVQTGDYENLVDEMDEMRMVLFVGSDNRRFFNLSLTTKAKCWFIYDVAKAKGKENNPLTTTYIRRRYFYIEKCKDAQTLGLLVATLTSNDYLKVLKKLQTMASARGIKTQIISVGRINPAKLANFMEIDCFVLVGCPFNNLFESKDFYKPIVSVFEAEMALNPAWHLRYPETYVTDFKELLPEGKSFLAFNEDDIKSDDVSLLTGRIRQNAPNGNILDAANGTTLCEQEQALATRAGMEVMTTNIGLTFEDRTWQGLDPALGQTEPAVIQKGLSGIPIRYTHD